MFLRNLYDLLFIKMLFDYWNICAGLFLSENVENSKACASSIFCWGLRRWWVFFRRRIPGHICDRSTCDWYSQILRPMKNVKSDPNQRGAQITGLTVTISRYFVDSEHGGCNWHFANVGFSNLRFTNKNKATIKLRDTYGEKGLEKTTECYP